MQRIFISVGKYIHIDNHDFCPPLNFNVRGRMLGKVPLNIGGNKETHANQPLDFDLLIKKISTDFQQNLGIVQNSCIWFTACLVIRSLDPNTILTIVETILRYPK